MSDEATPAQMLGLAAQIVSSYVSKNVVSQGDLPAVIASVRSALSAPGEAQPQRAVANLTPAQIRRSITPDALISFEDGKPYKTLRRHLTIRGITPEAYRAKWGLPSDYPMTCETYSQQRSELALSLGLGKQRRKDRKPKDALAA